MMNDGRQDLEKERSEEQEPYVANVIQNERRSHATATSANSGRDRLMFEEQTCSRNMNETYYEIEKSNPRHGDGVMQVTCRL